MEDASEGPKPAEASKTVVPLIHYSPKFYKKVCEAYMEGLMWVMAYYYQGCQSWQWYYPYNYSPFACDMVKYVDKSFHPVFVLGRPFRPFEQLMGVLPAASRHCLPECMQSLMTDPSSPIIESTPRGCSLSTRMHSSSDTCCLNLLIFLNITYSFSMPFSSQHLTTWYLRFAFI